MQATPSPTGNLDTAVFEDLQRIEQIARADVLTESEPRLEWGETRPAALLFLDLVGFTGLSRELSSEELSLLTKRSFSIFETTARAFGGYCKEVVGDEGLYVFLGHPNCPPPCEAALRAGLGMLANLERINTLISGWGTARLQARCGVAYGEVTRRREVGEEEKLSVTGEAVNLAQRLESAAERNSLHTTREVLERAGELSEYEPAGSAELKGFGGVERFRVTGFREPEVWLRGGSEELVPLVGREREFERARSFIGELLDAGSAGETGMVLLQGPAAVGKSRLALELLRGLQEDRDLATATVHLTELGGVRDLAVDLLQVAGLDGENLPERWGELCERAADSPALDAEQVRRAREQLHVLAMLLESERVDYSALEQSDPVSFMDQCKLALGSCLELVTAVEQRPVLLVLDDMQWLDSGEELVRHLLAGTDTDRPVAAVATARPGYRHGGGLGEGSFERIGLSPLGREEGERILHHLLPGLKLPERLGEELHERAEGLPYFYEEFAGMLLRNGLAEPEGEGYRLSADLDSLQLPDSLTAMTLGRLDRLEEHHRRLLAAASVIGDRAEERLLLELDEALGITGEAEPREILDELARAGVLQRAGRGHWRFEHRLTREAVYESLLTPTRGELHGALVDLLKERRVRGAPSHFELGPELVEHLEGSGDLLGAHRELTDLLHELADSGRIEGLEVELRRARRLWEGAREETGELPETSPWQLWVEGTRHRRSGEVEAALSRYREALDLSRKLGERELEGKLCEALGWAHWYLGSVDRARSRYREALDIAREQGNLRGQGRVLSSLGIVHKDAGNYEAAIDCYREALEACRKAGARGSEGKALGNLGLVHLEQGRYEEALELIRQALEIAREVGDRRFEGIWLGNLGLWNRSVANFGKAREYFNQSLSLFRRIGDTRWQGVQHRYLAETALRQGDHGVADPHLDAAEELLEEAGDRRLLGFVGCARAESLLAQGEPERARERLDEVRRSADDLGLGPDSDLSRRISEVEERLAASG